ncbi:MAG: hypothetical protein A2X86_12240 [Bdellovibrionales bacterium GWA2_49_15]|nr:MAG: hypothetical protein A2X86_12240 [Bdellovibrionales bacterium GWA2_49_15]
MTKPVFSVVVTTYNHEKKLLKTLESLVGQTLKDFEVHIIDDGSTDNTKSVVDSFRGILDLHYYHQENWGGPARGRNVGIENANCEWIAFLDADDWWYPTKLEEVAKFLPGMDVIYHELDYFNANGPMRRGTNGRKLKNPFFEDLLMNGNCLSNSGVCARRSIIKRVGMVSEDKNLIAVEDYDLWLKISKISERFHYIPVALGAYWGGDGTLSSYSLNYIQRIKKITGNYLNQLEGAQKREAMQREKYIIARNKKALGDLTATADFFNIVVYSRSISLKMKALFFALTAFFRVKALRKFQTK